MADLEDDLLCSYRYELDGALIAQAPLPERSRARMLVARRTGGEPVHAHIADLPGFLDAGDLVVVNDTRVLPARLFARKGSGGRVEILGLSEDGDGWTCLVRPSARLALGCRVQVVGRGGQVEGPSLVIDGHDAGTRRVRTQDGTPMEEVFRRWGEMPLPPYIRRNTGPTACDAERYQSVFARYDGAVAAPTASLHFDATVLRALDERGVRVLPVTLHVGGGTFLPVRTERLSDHPMHEEPFAVPEATAEALGRAMVEGRHILAVGTTAFRALESWHRAGRPSDGAFRRTRLFVHPAAPPELSLSLLTNFHLPETTLLALVAALLGRRRTLTLYAQAAEAGYRFFSYGDATLLL